MSRAGDWFRRHRLPLLFVAACWLIRAALIFQGGQLCWPDEWRYYRSVELVARLSRGEVREPLRHNFEQGGHVGYIFAGVLPASVQGAVRAAGGPPAHETLWIPALYFALFSAAIPGLVFALALRVGAARGEALAAAAFAALSTALLSPSRHLFPYDLSMALWLSALWLGLGGAASTRRCLACGLLAGTAFVVYNGYWLASGLSLAVLVLRRPAGLGDAARRAATAFAGLIAPVAFLAAMSHLAGASYLGALRTHSGALIGGLYSEGVTLPWKFLWHNEGLLLAVWLAGTLASLRLPRGRLWAGLAVAVYGALVLFSLGLEKFVVFGRLVRQMIPFLCLAAAAGWSTRPRLLPAARRAAWAALALIAASNWHPLFRQVFPDDFQRAAVARAGREHLQVVNSVVGPQLRDEPDLLRPARFLVVNTTLLKPVNGESPVRAGQTLMETPHPLQLPALQYDGLWPHERAILRNPRHAMRLVDTLPDPAP